MIRPAAKREAQKAWDRIRADAEKLDRADPGAGEGYLLQAAGALDRYRQEAFRAFQLSGVSGRREAR